MRTFIIATTGLALLAGGEANAQRVVAPGPGDIRVAPLVPPPAPPASRWGSRVDGRWWGGVNAPGGWAAYRRPVRGWILPAYWTGPRFAIVDWRAYGLGMPAAGYGWSRYYDDAVLLDRRGAVQDVVGGLDWDGRDVVAAPPPPAPPPPPVRVVERRRDGVTGAVVGGVVGGVAGNVIAGRGNRLGGTLIGGGIGAAAGYAVDRASGPRRQPMPPVDAYPDDHAYGEPGYAPPPPPREVRRVMRMERHRVPVAPDDAPPLYPPVAPYHAPPPPPVWASPDGRTTVTTSGGGYYGGSTTTIVVQTAPVVTTTTTEYYTDEVTYVRPRATRSIRKRAWRARPACACR